MITVGRQVLEGSPAWSVDHNDRVGLAPLEAHEGARLGETRNVFFYNEVLRAGYFTHRRPFSATSATYFEMVSQFPNRYRTQHNAPPCVLATTPERPPAPTTPTTFYIKE